jgi:uncharacterized protein (TIGR00369 family)
MPSNNTIIEQAMLEQLSLAFTKIPFNQMLGLQLKNLNTNDVTMCFSMKEQLIGNFLQGILHGGVISSVLDMAGGMAVMASIIHQRTNLSIDELANVLGKCSTVDLQISYLRPGKGEHFIAKAWLLKSGAQISFVRMELLNHNDTLIASGTGTYICHKG